MFNRTYKLFVMVLLLAAHSAYAGDVKIKECGWGIMSALNRLEVKGASKLEIIEFKIDKPIDYIFGEHKMVLAPLSSKYKTQLYRLPGVGPFVNKFAFKETRFIPGVAEKNLAELLEHNAVYTYTIQDNKLTMAKTKPGFVRNYASKHAMLSANKEGGTLRMAGEMWKDEAGRIHFDPGSGTYKPNNEDLQRAEIFFKQHMGLTDAVPHYFKPATAMPKAEVFKPTKLTTKVKQLDNAQTTIEVKRYINSSLKMQVMSSARHNQMEAMENEVITLKDPEGKEVQYQFRRIETMVNEETYFDSLDMKLSKTNGQLKVNSQFALADEKNITQNSISETDYAVKSARKTVVGNSPLSPIVLVRKEIVQLALYPVKVPKGKKANPVFLLSLETKNVTSKTEKLKGKTETEYFSSIEELSADGVSRPKQLNQLENQIQNRFSLTKAPMEKDGLALINALETNVGQ
jgi:hypothetical protein